MKDGSHVLLQRIRSLGVGGVSDSIFGDQDRQVPEDECGDECVGHPLRVNFPAHIAFGIGTR